MKKMKRWNAILTILLGGVFFLLWPCWAQGQASKSSQELPWGRDLKVGGCWAMTGPGASWGLGLAMGLEQGVADINKSGGVVFEGKRHKVIAVNEDDEYKGALAVVKVKKLIEEQKVDSFIGFLSSAAVLATQPLTEPANVIQFCCSQGKLIGPTHPLTFRALTYVGLHADAFYNWCKDNFPQYKRVADIAPNDASGWGSTDGNAWAASAYGCKIVFQENYERGLSDFSPLVAKALRAKPDIITLAGVPPGDAGLVVKAAREAGFDKIIYGATRQDLSLIVKVAGPKFSQNVYSNEYIPWDPKAFPGAKQVYEAYMKKAKEWSTLVPMGYWYAQCFKAAVEASNSTDGKKMAEALKKMKVNTIEGPIHFGPPYAVSAYYPLAISTVKDGKAVMLGFRDPKPMTDKEYEFKFEKSMITP